MKKSISRIIGVIMLIVAIVFIVFALNHPEKSFPWNNTITWLLYGIYFLVIVVLLIAPKMKKWEILVYQISKSFHTSAGSDETAARSFCTLKPKGGFKCQTKPKNILHLPAKRQTAFRDGGSTGQNFWSQRHGCTNTVTRISWWSMPEDRRKCIPSMVTIMEISVYLEITKG